jgi:prepilin-type N-terminal cleavage/methylation domain-containing protein
MMRALCPGISVRRAFTLLEVMVSIAILAISLTVLLTFSGNILVKSGRSEAMTVASMLAKQKMVELELELEKEMKKGVFPEEKSEDGKFELPYEDYSWEMTINKVELPAPAAGEKGSIQQVISKQLSKEIAKSVRELKLIIRWTDMGEEQEMDVTTHIVKL